MRIDQAIQKLKTEFIQKNQITEISDWQGNKDFEGEKMHVQRNVIMICDVPRSQNVLQEVTGCDLPWAEEHFKERISGIPSNPGETYKFWPYHNNLDDSKYKEEIFSHTYQERFWPKEANNKNPITGGEGPNWGIRFRLGDLDDLIQLLCYNPKTRQAYLPIWFPEDTWAAGNQQRVPCSLGYYFWIEEGKLHCNYTIRSCDLFRHFRNDVYLAARLMQYIESRLHIKLYPHNPRVEVGTLTMYIFNLHLFEKDLYPFSKKENKLQKKIWEKE